MSPSSSGKARRGRAAPRPPAKKSGPSPFVLVVVGLVVVGAALLAVLAATGGDEETSALGEPAPVLEGTDLRGEPLTIPSEGAKLVVFLAHWCPHCQAEVPLLVDWIDAGDVPEGVEVYGVATNNDPNADNYPADEWLAREGWQQPTLLDDEANTFADDYGVEGFPFLAFVDEDGTIVETMSGEQPISEVQAAAEDLVS